MENNKIITGNCWVAYFDIVGFKNDIEDIIKNYGKDGLEILYQIYYDIINIAKNEIKSQEELDSKLKGVIGCKWFSDTFIFFAPEDSQDSYDFYLSIEAIIHNFFIEVLGMGTMFRGALSFGEFYANQEENVFFGPALIDAYEYADKQRWSCGVVLTPKTCEKLKGTKLDVEQRVDYARYKVIVKRETSENPENDVIKIRKVTEELFAFRISNYPYVKETIERKKQETKMRYPKEYDTVYKPKYDRVLKFIEETKLKITDIAACN